MANNDNTKSAQAKSTGERRQYLTMTIGEQPFGILVSLIHEVIGHQNITRIPLAPREIAGVLNLRGRTITAIDVRARLGMPSERQGGRSVLVEHAGEVHSLMVDSVGDVIMLDDALFEPHPRTISQAVRDVSSGIFRLDDMLLVVLDVQRLVDFPRSRAA